MSDVMIFKATSDNYFLKGPDFEYFYKAKPDEKFVKLEDYARIKAEVERLRKAGDKLAGGRTHTFTKYGKLIEDPIIVEWNAAKEGKPSV